MILRASPSTIAVLPTPGSPINTGLFLVRRDNTWITRLISSSRPITGSSLPLRASSVRSFAYFSSDWYFASGFWSVTRCVPRTPCRAFKMASCVAPNDASSNCAPSFFCTANASSRCSVETYSSLKFSASLKACSITFDNTADIFGCAFEPLTLGSLLTASCAFMRTCAAGTSARSSSGIRMPSLSCSKADNKCSGSTSGLPFSSASELAACTASCDFTVNLSHRIAIYPPPDRSSLFTDQYESTYESTHIEKWRRCSGPRRQIVSSPGEQHQLRPPRVPAQPAHSPARRSHPPPACSGCWLPAALRPRRLSSL